jgi:hypothetical protein
MAFDPGASLSCAPPAAQDVASKVLLEPRALALHQLTTAQGLELADLTEADRHASLVVGAQPDTSRPLVVEGR